MSRHHVIFGLVIVNVLLLSALVAGPLRAQILPNGMFFDCCKGDTCCSGCCLWTSNCSGDGQCGLF